MSRIVFKINGKQYEADGTYGPDFSLNEYIRTVADLRGTKVLCHEGGCGACIVAVRIPTPPNNELKIVSVNSCLVSILSCHGWEIITVEGIGNRIIGYHEIQKALAKFNGTQCGYCTPGWIMNMYSLYKSKNKNLSAREIENSFASNICRCTGYRSIADAFKSFAVDADEIVDIEEISKIKSCRVNCKEQYLGTKAKNDLIDDWCYLTNMNSEQVKIKSKRNNWYKVYNLQDAFKIIKQNINDYQLIAGNTGQGVYHVTEYSTNVIDIYSISEIKGFVLDVNLNLGAGMTLSDMMELFLQMSSENENFSYLKQFYEHLDLVAHIPVKNLGTIGGNLYMKYAKHEFQSDIFLLLETVGAMITIASNTDENEIISLIDFLKIDMKGKIIINVLLPPLSNWCTLKSFKIMPRSQNAHAIVNAGFLFNFHPNSNIIKEVTITYGGISPDFVHAYQTEVLLIGKDLFTNNTLQIALKSLSVEINPIEIPPEPSPKFRKMLALSLFYKAILSICPTDKINTSFQSGGEVIKRSNSKGYQTFDTDKSIWPLNQPVPKVEALAQCSGEATFANDLPKQSNEVYGAFVTADVSPGSVISHFDTSEALKLSGVISFYSAKNIPGDNTFTPTNMPLLQFNEEILCSDKVKFYGQPAGIVVAVREKDANIAAGLVKIHYSFINTNAPLLTINDVLKSNEQNERIKMDQRVEPTDTGNDVKAVFYGELYFKTQYHYHMEPQTCVVKPTEDGMDIYSSTQWLDLTNVAVAQCIKVPVNSVNVIVRRVGGAYGAKITRSTQVACAAAIVSHFLGRTCRFILSLQSNIRIVGKRLPTFCNFEVGVSTQGEIQYLKNIFYQETGCSLNPRISPITLKHFSNCYDSSRWFIEANSVITDTPANTWCRAPASCEGVAMIEYIMERIAHNMNKDALDVRILNMKKENNPIPDLIEQLKIDSNYTNRLIEVKKFNECNRWRKRALKIMPMTYELFYIGPYNAIVSVFHADGSVAITHGGIEMGQGINTKAAQVCAHMLEIPIEKISVKPSTSVTSPNSMTTGGSVGSECIAFAIVKACNVLLERLNPIKNIHKNASWEEIIKKAYISGIDLQASYMFSTDDLKPYEIYGVVALEVELDLLTGNHDIRRVDLLEDTGRSLSPEIDIGQIEGAFVMGLGYWTFEQIIYDPSSGRLLTDRTWTYKPPGLKDIPADFRIYFRRNSKNEFGVLQSKATGEPALCLAAVITHALREAIRAGRLDAGYEDQWVEIEYPCTVENIYKAIGHKLEHFRLN